MTTDVLVFEVHDVLRGILRALLTMPQQYDVREVATMADAFADLRAHPAGMIVVWSNRDADHHLCAAFFAGVVCHPEWARRHQYVLLSTNPRAIPQPMRRHLVAVRATILPKPFDVDALLATVRTAAEHLAATK